MVTLPKGLTPQGVFLSGSNKEAVSKTNLSFGYSYVYYKTEMGLTHPHLRGNYF